MLTNPIIRRELFGALRTRKALWILVGVAASFAGLVLLRWPSESLAELSGAQSRQMFYIFGYGMLAMVCLFAPIFPATSIVRERSQGTLTLLLSSPMKPWSIYVGKLLGILIFAGILLLCTLPSAVACYSMGGVSLVRDIGGLYLLLALTGLQLATMALLVSSWTQSSESALLITYGLLLAVAIAVLIPFRFLQGQEGELAAAAEWLRCVSPVAAMMETLGHRDVMGQGLISSGAVTWRYGLFSLLASGVAASLTIMRIAGAIVDRSRSQGVITDDQSIHEQIFRRLVFVVDPQRRKSGIGWWLNPVMVKEFRSRRFGRMHWLIRLVAICAVVSLVLTWASATGTMQWGVEEIGGLMVFLQVALLVSITPALGAPLISGERESGGWELLKMTPLSAGVIFRGKLASIAFTLMLVLMATLPGYMVMMLIKPDKWVQVWHVLICLLLTALFALSLSSAVSVFFRRTAGAMVVSYSLLGAVCALPLLIWLAQDHPFNHSQVNAALTINPIAAALTVIQTPGFETYDLLPVNWYFLSGASFILLTVLAFRMWRLTRPG